VLPVSGRPSETPATSNIETDEHASIRPHRTRNDRRQIVARISTRGELTHPLERPRRTILFRRTLRHIPPALQVRIQVLALVPDASADNFRGTDPPPQSLVAEHVLSQSKHFSRLFLGEGKPGPEDQGSGIALLLARKDLRNLLEQGLKLFWLERDMNLVSIGRLSDRELTRPAALPKS
jgi:hypothetical protein